MAHTIGIGTHSRPRDANQSFTKHPRCGALGHHEARMHGIWGPRQITIDATSTMCLKRAHKEFQGQQNCFPNTARSPISANMHI